VKLSRLKRIRLCARATTLHHFQRSGVPVSAFESLRWTFVSAFSLARKKRGVNGLPCRESSQGLQPNVNANLFGSFGQSLRLALDRKGLISLDCNATSNSEHLDFVSERATRRNLDMADPRVVQLALLVPPESRLRAEEGVVSAFGKG
jgi:hypothetical protein